MPDDWTMTPQEQILTGARLRSEGEENKTFAEGSGLPGNIDIAERLEGKASGQIVPVRVGKGGEIVPDATMHRTSMGPYRDMVASPTHITVEASRNRLELANDAGVLDTALDLCDTIQAGNSAERMLAGQMAALHRLTMKIAAHANETVGRLNGVVRAQDRDAYTVQLNRLVGSMARASAEYQNAMVTLSKARSGGKQSITVTHIQNTQVNSGGQAVVNGGHVAGTVGGVGGQAVGGTNGKGQ